MKLTKITLHCAGPGLHAYVEDPKPTKRRCGRLAGAIERAFPNVHVVGYNTEIVDLPRLQAQNLLKYGWGIFYPRGGAT